MELVIDKVKLYGMLKEFHALTGIRVSFLENHDNPVMGVPSTNCALCAYKQRDRAFYLKCKACDRQAFAAAMQSDHFYIYDCHYHLIEALQPVRIYGNTIGYFLLGQILTDRENFIARNNPTAYELELLDRLVPTTPEKLQSSAKILSWLAKYSILNKDIDLIAKHNFESVSYYLKTHYAEKISVDDLCEQFHFSRSALFALFKKECNLGVTAYLNLIRMNKAKDLLKEHDVNDTAQLVGIEDGNYLARCFKKAFGVTPSEYAKAFRIADKFTLTPRKDESVLP